MELLSIWVCFFPIFSIILCGILGTIISNIKQNEFLFIDYFFGIGIIICIPIWIIGIIYVSSLNDKNITWENTETLEIYAINDTSNLQGKFSGGALMSRGIINENWQYVAYIKDNDKITLKQFDCNTSNIYEKENMHTIKIYRQKINSYNILFFKTKEWYNNIYYYDIYLPKGSIISDYNLDLQK